MTSPLVVAYGTSNRICDMHLSGYTYGERVRCAHRCMMMCVYGIQQNGVYTFGPILSDDGCSACRPRVAGYRDRDNDIIPYTTRECALAEWEPQNDTWMTPSAACVRLNMERVCARTQTMRTPGAAHGKGFYGARMIWCPADERIDDGHLNGAAAAAAAADGVLAALTAAVRNHRPQRADESIYEHGSFVPVHGCGTAVTCTDDIHMTHTLTRAHTHSHSHSKWFDDGHPRCLLRVAIIWDFQGHYVGNQTVYDTGKPQLSANSRREMMG